MGTSKSYLVHATGVEGQPIRLEVRASSATQAKAKFKKMVDETVSNVMAESMANRAGKEPTPEVKAALKHIAYAALGGPINRVPSAYAWLVVDPDGNVWAGNEYKQDAMDAFREIHKLLPYGSKVMSKATYKRMKGTANRSGKVGGIKLAQHPKYKHLSLSKDGNVRAGRVQSDRFYTWEELPPKEKLRDFGGSDDQQLVRVKYGTGKSARYEYVPLDHFMRINDGKSPSGRPADGFAGDSYFSGVAIKMIPGGEGSDHEYQVWTESW